jgi:formylglycine-generating enzyme required for sulfatase activity
MRTLSAMTLLAASVPSLHAVYPLWDGKESVAAYAKRANLEPTLSLDLGGGVKWEGVLIPAGKFLMGSAPEEAPKEAAGEKPHTVTITRPFYLGKYEVTQAQYAKVTGGNPSLVKGDTLPVHNVTWKDAQAFCDMLGKQTGRTVQLPTDAEWEYACRAGTTTAYHSGNAIADLEKVAWFGTNSGGKPHPVGEKVPNAWGLYDMHGNIREYVRDLFSDAAPTDATDPTGPAEGDPKNHVVRGGAYTANAAVAGNCRAASRRPTENPGLTGFRVAVALPAPK